MADFVINLTLAVNKKFNTISRKTSEGDGFSVDKILEEGIMSPKQRFKLSCEKLEKCCIDVVGEKAWKDKNANLAEMLGEDPKPDKKEKEN